jgi:DNA-directed RNA polymerase, mitochondrial
MLPRCGIRHQAGTVTLLQPEQLCFNRPFQVLQCIGDLFQGANDIMTWLTASARIISKSIPGDRVFEAMELDTRSKVKKTKPGTTRLRKEQMTGVVWTTPLGLPIVQPYRKIKRKQIMTSVQSVYISDPNAPAEGE